MTTMLDTILIANRGEIAVRVARTLRRMGDLGPSPSTAMRTPTPGTSARPAAVRLLPASARESYLDIDKVIAAAATGARGIHPGYSSSRRTPTSLRPAPKPESPSSGRRRRPSKMGDKIAAKAAVSAFGVPVVPGISRPGLSDDDLVAVHPTSDSRSWSNRPAGGGGKGIVWSRRAEDLPAALASARREGIPPRSATTRCSSSDSAAAPLYPRCRSSTRRRSQQRHPPR